MASTSPVGLGVIKIEDSSSPELLVTLPEPTPPGIEAPASIDTKDPEGFLKRCSGYNKKTKLRCGAVIGKKTQQNTHPTYLPTCSAHRDQQSFAGWCQFKHAEDETCGRLFRWTPPYYELCSIHQGHPDTPCHFLKLPLELRHEIFRYLLPTKPISSSTAVHHDGHNDHIELNGPRAPVGSVTARIRAPLIYPYSVIQPSSSDASSASLFPIPLMDLFLVSRQIYNEAKDLLFSIAVFTIDIRKDGTFMCGRRLLEPRRADGSSHFLADEADEAKEKFLKAFDWAAVKNYSVDILLENWSNSPTHTHTIMHTHTPHTMSHNSEWDEEVEIYDIRDYVSVVVSGILAKSQNLCKLQVRLCLADFTWSEDQILANTKLIVSPFERLRNVRQPHINGVFLGRPDYNHMLSVQRPQRQLTKGPLTPSPVCSVPPLPIHNPVLIPGMPLFDAYTADWVRWISSSNKAPITKKAPIRAMFTEFKDFYSKLSSIVPDITYRNGRHAFLHRARVAREQEDVESFRHLRNELIQYWYAYLDQQERMKTDMNARLSRMLDTDIYPSHEWEEPDKSARRSSSATQGNAQSPVLLNVETMAKEGIPMTGNPRHTQMQPACLNSRFQKQLQFQRQQQVALMQRHAQAQARLAAATAQTQRQAAARLQARKQAQWQMAAQFDPTLPHMRTHEDANVALYVEPSTSAHHLPSTDTAPTPETWEDLTIGVDPTNDPACVHAGTSSSSTKRSQAELVGEPGPSTKRRRVDTGFRETEPMVLDRMEQAGNGSWAAVNTAVDSGDVAYVGKGKGKVIQHEVICLD